MIEGKRWNDYREQCSHVVVQSRVQVMSDRSVSEIQFAIGFADKPNVFVDNHKESSAVRRVNQQSVGSVRKELTELIGSEWLDKQ